MLLQIYAWHCIVMKIMYQSTRIKNKKYNEKLNKAMQECWTSVGQVWVGGGGYVCPNSEFSNTVISHFEE